MRSIRLRRRADEGSASPGADRPRDGARVERPRHPAEAAAGGPPATRRAAGAGAAPPERGAPAVLRRPGRRAGARRRRRRRRSPTSSPPGCATVRGSAGCSTPTSTRSGSRSADSRSSAGVDPFLHWLTVGWDERVVPTVLFDEAFYVGRHPDLASGPDWAFAQYLRAGLLRPRPVADAVRAQLRRRAARRMPGSGRTRRSSPACCTAPPTTTSPGPAGSRRG